MDFGEPDPEAWQVQQMHPHSPLPYAGTKSLLTLPQRGLCSECMHPTSSAVSLRAVAVPIFLNRGRRQISGTAVGGSPQGWETVLMNRGWLGMAHIWGPMFFSPYGTECTEGGLGGRVPGSKPAENVAPSGRESVIGMCPMGNVLENQHRRKLHGTQFAPLLPAPHFWKHGKIHVVPPGWKQPAMCEDSSPWIW